MKYECVCRDYERLRALAAQENAAVPAFLTQLEQEKAAQRRERLLAECGGNEELAERILRLETPTAPDDGFAELQAQFPKMDSPEKLPESVREAAAARGTRLLDEYLRYRLLEHRRRESAERQRRRSEAASIGPQREYAPATAPENAAFVQGVWSR
jgi:hypothetical protein